MSGGLFARLRGDARGTTVIEYAILLPVHMVLFMGLGEIAYEAYVQSVLVGAIQKAGRDSTIQGNDTDAKTDGLDDKVMAVVHTVSKTATYESSRKSYSSFGNVKPEYFADDNGNGKYDKATECFTDVNGNGVWDADPGIDGQGGASDVTVYKITISYPRLFPIGLFGWSDTVVTKAATTFKNQPYASQKTPKETQVCP